MLENEKAINLFFAAITEETDNDLQKATDKLRICRMVLNIGNWQYSLV